MKYEITNTYLFNPSGKGVSEPAQKLAADGWEPFAVCGETLLFRRPLAEHKPHNPDNVTNRADLPEYRVNFLPDGTYLGGDVVSTANVSVGLEQTFVGESADTVASAETKNAASGRQASLISRAQHEAIVTARREAAKRAERKTGVACDKCGGELLCLNGSSFINRGGICEKHVVCDSCSDQSTLSV